MTKTSLLIMVGLVVGAVPSLVARQQAQTQFEYLEATPIQVPSTPNGAAAWDGYRACVAASNTWTCREFHNVSLEFAVERSESSITMRPAQQDMSLPKMLSVLGTEGWQMVSAVPARDRSSSEGFRYLFKRPVTP